MNYHSFSDVLDIHTE